MEKFLVSSEDCLILKAFKESGSLRSAAQLLNCDPASLARKAQAISTNYSFLQKINNRWQLTNQGLEIVAWTDIGIESQKKIFSGRSSIRIAVPTWFSHEVALPKLKKFNGQLDANLNFSMITPHKSLELSLLDGSIDFAITDELPLSTDVSHKIITREKLVPVSSYDWKEDFEGTPEQSILKSKPFLHNNQIRENTILHLLENYKKAYYQFDNPLTVKEAVLQGLGWSILPEIITARPLAEKKLYLLPFDFLIEERNISVWWLRQRLDIRHKINTVCEWVQTITEKENL